MNPIYNVKQMGLVNVFLNSSFATVSLTSVPLFGVGSFGNIVSIFIIPILVFFTTKQHNISQFLTTMKGSIFILTLSSVTAIVLNGPWSVIDINAGWFFFVLGVAYLRLVSVHTILSLTYIIVLTPWNMWWVSALPLLVVGVVSFLQVTKTAGVSYSYFLFKGTLFSIFSGGLPFLSGKSAFTSLPLPQTPPPVSQENTSKNDEDEGEGESGEEGVDSEEEIGRRRLRGVKIDIGKIMILSYIFISIPATILAILF